MPFLFDGLGGGEGTGFVSGDVSIASIIRRAVSLHAHERGLVARNGGATALTATGGSSSTLIDTVGFPQGASPRYYKDWWAWNVTKGLIRPVVSGDDATSTFTLGGASWTTPSASDIYMVLRDHPENWWAAANTALSVLLSDVDYLEWTPTNAEEDEYTFNVSPLTYDLSIRQTQIFRVEHRPVGDEYAEWEDWNDGVRGWIPRIDGSTVYLRFNGPKPTTDDRMRVQIVRQFPRLDSYTDTIDVDEVWAAEATLMAMSRALGQPQVPNDAWTRIGRDAAIAYDGRRVAILGTDAYRKVSTSNRRDGVVGVRGRRGRRR